MQVYAMVHMMLLRALRVGAPVRLLIIAPESYPIPSAKGTSVETCIYNIASALATYHSVTVVSRSASYLPRATTRGSFRIIRVLGGTGAKYITQALLAVTGQRFDHIQVDNRPVFLRAVRKHFPKTPLSLFLHSLTFVTPPKTSISKARSQLAIADLIVANSHSLKSCLSQLYPSQRHKIEVAHLGVDSSRFRPPTITERARSRAAYGVRDKYAIVYAGRLNPKKGLPVLIRAADLVHQEIPSAKLLIAGSGKKDDVLYTQALARGASVPVTYLGPVLQRQMPQVYWAADCFVCPTQSHEAFGLVVVEALASGVPTVASHNGGIKEIITHNVNGLLVENYYDPQSFAEAITNIAQHNVLAKRLGEEGRKTCLGRFSWQRTGETLHRLYFGGVFR